MTNFIELGLPKYICAALSDIGFTEATEVQEKSIPLVRAGHDLMASAHTGSGKTAAFALPVIEYIDRCRAAEARAKAQTTAAATGTTPGGTTAQTVGTATVKTVGGTATKTAGAASAKAAGTAPVKIVTRALVLVPTRELAIQVAEEFQRFSKNYPLRVATIYGGSSFGAQLREIKRGCHVIVATPGRLYDHLERKTLNLDTVEKLILDEADRLMDMGFMPQVRKIVAKLPKQRQTIMFSATINRRIEEIGSEYLNQPMVVRSTSGQVEPEDIEQRIIDVDEFDKDALLLKLIQAGDMNTVIVFTETRRKASWVKSRLRDANVMAEELHSDIPQSQREKTCARYREGKFSILVATDVAARGLDIPAISHVVNYDLPNTSEDYVHRIGRTGRAGRKGIALSFVSKEQRHLLRDIQKLTGNRADPSAQAAQPTALANGKKPNMGRTFRPRGRARVS